MAVGVITTIDADRGAPRGGAAASDILVNQLSNRPHPGSVATVPDAVLPKLHSNGGAGGVTIIHTNPLGINIPAAKLGKPSSFGHVPAGLVSCAQLSRIRVHGRCPAGAQAVAIPAGDFLVPRWCPRRSTGLGGAGDAPPPAQPNHRTRNRPRRVTGSRAWQPISGPSRKAPDLE